MKRLLSLIVVLLAAALSFAQQAVKPQLERTLRTALADERASHAYCEAVIAKFGPRAPFAKVVEGESLHAAYVEELMFRHNVQVPKNPFERKPKETRREFAERLKVPATYPEALQRAVQLERRQGPLYNRITPGTPKDVQAVFGKLRREALRRHLPEFQRVGN